MCLVRLGDAEYAERGQLFHSLDAGQVLFLELLIEIVRAENGAWREAEVFKPDHGFATKPDKLCQLLAERRGQPITVNVVSEFADRECPSDSALGEEARTRLGQGSLWHRLLFSGPDYALSSIRALQN